jgi:Tfp pilus assembly protein PilZ
MILHNRLTSTKRSLLSWSRSLFSDARLQLHMANEVILRLDIAQESRTLSIADRSRAPARTQASCHGVGGNRKSASSTEFKGPKFKRGRSLHQIFPS